MKLFIFCAGAFLCFTAIAWTSDTPDSIPYEFLDSSGDYKSEWGRLGISQKTYLIEKYRNNIEYCLQHIGQPFQEISMAEMGSDKGYAGITPYITYGLVALKYQDDYKNSQKAAGYFYQDWLEYKKHLGGKDSLWHEGPGDYDPLGFAIGQWEYAGLYATALSHYQEYFRELFLSQPGISSLKEQKKHLKERLSQDPKLKQKYIEFMRDWERTKKLAKAKKAQPLEAIVQNHEWFYSDNAEEVLNALEYYHANKVFFMLEKALLHKDPKVAAQAKEYLEDLKKGEKNETGKKQP